MACMPVEIVVLGEVPQVAVEDAIREANAVQGQFIYSLMGPSEAERFAVFAFKNIYGPEFLNRMATVREEIRGYQPYVIAFVDGQLSGERLSNLFANDRPADGLGVATIANVPGVIFPEDRMNAYFLHRLAKQTLSFIAPHQKNHDDTRDCVYDLKVNKLDIFRSMKTRAFCDDCRGALLTGRQAISAAQLNALDSMLCASGKLLKERQDPANTSYARPRVFIGSSSEGLNVANDVQSLLSKLAESGRRRC